MSRIIDLTMTLKPGMRGYDSVPIKTKAGDGWNARTLSLYTHAGTHMDAPLHFIEDGNTIDNLDLKKCVGPCRIIDLTPIQPKALITVSSLGKAADLIQPGDRIILKTDWSKLANTPAWRDDLPRISKELALWFVERQIAFIGVEPPSIADVNNIAELTEVHEILLKAEIVIAEGLTNLDELTRDVVEIFALPLKPEGSDGCPARVIALEREE
ncbi:MAG: cyclase family protein [Verrucomicrobiota bacterium]